MGFNPFIRPLFKPILNKAARSAYRMTGTAQEFATRAAEKARPYAKNYMDAAAGNQGRFKQGVALGGPLLAYGAIPERVQTLPVDEIVEEKPKETKPPEDDLLTFPETEKNKIVDSDTETHEEVNATGDSVEDSETTNTALLEQSNMYAGLIDNDSLKRIEGYKDVIRQIMGDGDEGQKMQSLAMLLQVGSALMSGRTDQPGVAGFFDVVGQAGMQMAPTLFQMGVEKGKADREIGAAALNMYMSELDKMNDRSGPFTVVYENIYKENDKGEMMFDRNGDPILQDRQRLQTFYRKSPEIQNLMNINSQLGYDRFTFVDTTASKEGIKVSAPGGGQATFKTPAQMDQQLKYAKYLKRTLDTMADFIMPTIIENRDTVLGAIGEAGKFFGPKVALFNQIMDAAVTSGSGGDMKDFEREVGAYAKENTVPERADYLMDTPNGKVGVWLDHANKYGENEGARYSDDGKTMLDPGKAAEYVTWDSMKMILENPDRSALMTFETTLGLALARDRQPTGRMLADVLRRSFAETKMTGFGDSVYTSPEQVIEGFTFIYNQLYNNMLSALEGAEYTSDYDFAQESGWTHAPDAFKISGIDKFKGAYYQLRFNDKENHYRKDIEGAELYGAYAQSIEGGLTQDHQENKESTQSITDNILEQLEQ